jgi:hypothetical protein
MPCLPSERDREQNATGKGAHTSSGTLAVSPPRERGKTGGKAHCPIILPPLKQPQVNRFGLSMLDVSGDIKADTHPFIQGLQSSMLDDADMYKYVAAAIVRLNEAVSLLRIKKFYRPN